MSYLVREFECCCVGLLSSKVTDRSKSSEKLSGLLCSSSAVQALNKSDTFTWNSVLNNVHGFLIKEAEKLASDELKKTISDTTYLKKKVYGDYLLDVVKVANQDGKTILSRVIMVQFIVYISLTYAMRNGQKLCGSFKCISLLAYMKKLNNSFFGSKVF